MKVIDFLGTSQGWQGTGQSRNFFPVPLVPWESTAKIFSGPARSADFCSGPGPTGDKKCRDSPASPDIYYLNNIKIKKRSIWELEITRLAGRDRDPDIAPGQTPIPGTTS